MRYKTVSGRGGRGRTSFLRAFVTSPINTDVFFVLRNTSASTTRNTGSVEYRPGIELDTICTIPKKKKKTARNRYEFDIFLHDTSKLSLSFWTRNEFFTGMHAYSADVTQNTYDTIYRNFDTIHRKFDTCRNFVTIYRNFDTIYRNFDTIYRNVHTIYRMFDTSIRYIGTFDTISNTIPAHTQCPCGSLLVGKTEHKKNNP